MAGIKSFSFRQAFKFIAYVNQRKFLFWRLIRYIIWEGSAKKVFPEESVVRRPIFCLKIKPDAGGSRNKGVDIFVWNSNLP